MLVWKPYLVEMPTVRTGDIETYYERHGEGYPIIFAHGGGWDHRQWSPQVETLTDEYEIITYDARFHGKTELVEDEHDIGPNFLSDDLQALVDRLDLDHTNREEERAAGTRNDD